MEPIDPWAKDYTDELGDIAYSKLESERDAARAEAANIRSQLAAVIVDYQDRLAGAFADIGALAMEREALRDELAALRLIAQNALDHGGDMELVYAPLYQQALEDIASEPQDDE